LGNLLAWSAVSSQYGFAESSPSSLQSTCDRCTRAP
jgi:hypothetical protein